MSKTPLLPSPIYENGHRFAAVRDIPTGEPIYHLVCVLCGNPLTPTNRATPCAVEAPARPVFGADAPHSTGDMTWRPGRRRGR